MDAEIERSMRWVDATFVYGPEVTAFCDNLRTVMALWAWSCHCHDVGWDERVEWEQEQ